MSIDDVVVVATVRDEIRGKTFAIGTAEIERLIEATQVRMVAHVESDDVSSVCSESGVDEKAPSKEARAIADSYNGIKEIAVAIPSKGGDMQRSDGHPVSPRMMHGLM